MAIGIRVWIGIKDNTRSSDDDHCDPRTIAEDMATCQKMINFHDLTATHFPVSRLLILKGRMCDG